MLKNSLCFLRCSSGKCPNEMREELYTTFDIPKSEDWQLAWDDDTLLGKLSLSFLGERGVSTSHLQPMFDMLLVLEQCAVSHKILDLDEWLLNEAFKRRIAKWNDAISQWKAAHREEAHDYRAGLALLQNGKTECVYLQKQAAHILNLSPAAAENELARSSTDTSERGEEADDHAIYEKKKKHQIDAKTYVMDLKGQSRFTAANSSQAERLMVACDSIIELGSGNQPEVQTAMKRSKTLLSKNKPAKLSPEGVIKLLPNNPKITVEDSNFQGTVFDEERSSATSGEYDRNNHDVKTMSLQSTLLEISTQAKFSKSMFLLETDGYFAGIRCFEDDRTGFQSQIDEAFSRFENATDDIEAFKIAEFKKLGRKRHDDARHTIEVFGATRRGKVIHALFEDPSHLLACIHQEFVETRDDKSTVYTMFELKNE